MGCVQRSWAAGVANAGGFQVSLGCSTTTNEEESPLRPTTILRRLLGVTQLHVQDAHIAADGPLALRVRPSWRRSRCGACGRRAPRYDRRPLRQWLHVPWGRTPVWLQYAPWRVSCRQCGVRVERVPWAVGNSVFTAPLEELTAYLARVTDRTTVSRLLGVSWPAVGGVVERVVARRLTPGRLSGLRRIGIDEFAYRKRHHYLTVVVDHDTRRVVWAGEGRSAKTLDAFFELLGPSGCERIVLVTADLAASWQKALRAWVPQARVVFDRFHVERLASDAVDEVRRAEQRRVGAMAAKPLKGTRFCLLKHPARLKPGEKRRLATLRRENRALDRAYQLKEYLATILERARPDEASDLLNAWLAWAARSRLGPFVKLGRTVRKHATGILAYLDTRMTNGPVEGINNKLRVIARRAYGFHTHGALISMLFLCCGGVALAPHLPTPV